MPVLVVVVTVTVTVVVLVRVGGLVDHCRLGGGRGQPAQCR
jgi:hypothetical protein